MHGYWFPTLDAMREEGFLSEGLAHLGNSRTSILDTRYYYSGEVDPLGNACGIGTATDARNP